MENKRGKHPDKSDKAAKKQGKSKSDRKHHEKPSDLDKTKNKELFNICLKGVPKDGDKAVCFPNMSVAGCKVKACRLSHTLPQSAMSETVTQALTSLYGALRGDLP